MFTGLIEAMGDVAERVPVPSGVRLRIQVPFAGEIRRGTAFRSTECA
jgi:hypothetical protein